MDDTESTLRVLRMYAAKARARRVLNPNLPHGGNLVPTPEEAEAAIQATLVRRTKPHDTLLNVFRRCLREAMGVAPAADETSAAEHAPPVKESTCPPDGRRIKRSGKPDAG